MNIFRISYKSFFASKMQITDVRANSLKEAVQKLKALHLNVEVFAFMQR